MPKDYTLENQDKAWLRKSMQRFIAHPEGLTVYQLGLLFEISGSQKIARIYRAERKKFGPWCRNKDGIVE